MPSAQCSGFTSQGQRCRLRIKYNNATPGSEPQIYCHYHENQSPYFIENENIHVIVPSMKPSILNKTTIVKPTTIKPTTIKNTPKETIAPLKKEILIPEILNCHSCFDEIKSNALVHCGDVNHGLCQPCFTEYASISIKEYRKTNIKCGGHPECKQLYPTTTIRENINKDLQNAYDDELLIKYLDENKNFLFICPLCNNYKEMVENLEYLQKTKTQFSCKQCNKSVCMSCCHEHIKNELCIIGKNDLRKQIEELFSNERMRQCPSCRLDFLRRDGCCKMTCTRCGTKSCYVCKLKINNYDHFETTKCKLYTSESEIENLSIKIAKEKIYKNFGNSNEIHSLITEILEGPNNKKLFDFFKTKTKNKVQPNVAEIKMDPVVVPKENTIKNENKIQPNGAEIKMDPVVVPKENTIKNENKIQPNGAVDIDVIKNANVPKKKFGLGNCIVS